MIDSFHILYFFVGKMVYYIEIFEEIEIESMYLHTGNELVCIQF